MTIDDKIYRDLVKLGQDRCREMALSVMQLIDDDEQHAPFLVNLAMDLAGGAVQFLQDRKGYSREEALKAVLGGIVRGLDIEKYLDKHRDQNATKGPQPGGASASKSNQKNS